MAFFAGGEQKDGIKEDGECPMVDESNFSYEWCWLLMSDCGFKGCFAISRFLHGGAGDIAFEH